jgi:phosphohistidine swiveling domain-containing protein
MNFSTDRDLLAIEPAVFEDVPFAAQQRLDITDGSVTGTTLTSAAADFVTAQVDQGSVLLIGGTAYEVLARIDANTLTISLPRSSTDDPAIPGGDGALLGVTARTFAPQAELVHDGLLQMIGIEPEDPDAEITESAILSLSRLAQVEAVGTLERVYSGAASLIGDNETLLMKAGEYRRRFREACASTTVLLDTNGDGLPERRVRLGTVRLTRV